MRCFILYNPLAGGGKGLEEKEKLSSLIPGFELRYADVRELKDYPSFFRSMAPGEPVIICGGDGTLNRFVNRTAGLSIKNPIYVYAAGSANDFIRDIELRRLNASCSVNDYFRYLPVVTVKGRDYRFINGVSCSAEGVAPTLKKIFAPIGSCSAGERLKAVNKFLFRYRPCSAEVTVDGIRQSFQKVWMVPTVYGRYIDGGLCPVPEQDRFSPEGRVSVLILHDCGRLRTMFFSPSIFRGRAGNYSGRVDILSGDDVSVRFDRPAELQIDGESVKGISGYRVRSAAMIKKALPVSECFPETRTDSVYRV